MSGVRIKGTFTKDEEPLNGLVAVRESLIDDKLARHLVVGLIETHQVTERAADGFDPVPTVRFVQVEVVDVADADMVRGAMDRAHRKRVGRAGGADPTLFDPDQPDMDAAVREAEDQGLIEPVETPAESAEIVDDNLRAMGSEGLTDDQPDRDRAWPGDVDFNDGTAKADDDG